MVLKTYIPSIDNNNKQKEYYLTSIIEKIREKEDLEFNLYKIPENRKYEVLGVNTQDELQNIENILNNFNKK
jgi:bifunctional N-acetylglucosamine-1-phosphate-uridyltransferase/glucosamine-1-phosphate-acetyltransferase GlmU-like protein